MDWASLLDGLDKKVSSCVNTLQNHTVDRDGVVCQCYWMRLCVPANIMRDMSKLGRIRINDSIP